jgi:hypothetical protein
VFAATSRQGIFGHQNSMPRLSKKVIKTGGVNVAPLEIEQLAF